MNVLFVAGSSPDYLQDMLFHGLVQVLGEAAVVEHPENPRYHGAAPPDPQRPMLDFDLPRRDRPPLPELLGWADAVVIASLRGDALSAARDVLGLRRPIPTAFVDGEDDPYVRGIASRTDLYFKRETLRDADRLRARMPLRRLYHRARLPARWEDPFAREVAVAHAGARVVPLPFGVIDTGLAPTPVKDVDVAFLASPTSPLRARLAASLQGLAQDGFTVVAAADLAAGSALDWASYMDVLSRSRIGVSVRGLGYDTNRYWEIPYAGALLVAEWPRTVIPDNFVDGREASFAPAGRLAGRVRELLAGDTSAMAEAGRAKLLARHTSVHRAETVLERLATVRARR